MPELNDTSMLLGAINRLSALREAIPHRELAGEPEPEITNHEMDFMMVAARNMPRYDCPLSLHRSPDADEVAILLKDAKTTGLTTQLIAFCWYGDYDKSAGLLHDLFTQVVDEGRGTPLDDTVTRLGQLAEEYLIIKTAENYRGMPCYANLEYLINEYLNSWIPHNFQCADGSEVYEEAERIATDFFDTLVNLDGYSLQEVDLIRESILTHTIIFINNMMNPEEEQAEDATLVMG